MWIQGYFHTILNYTYDFIWEFDFLLLCFVNTGFDLIFRDQTRIKILFWISGWKTTGNYHLTQIWFRSRFFFLFSVVSFVFPFPIFVEFFFSRNTFCFVLKHTIFVEKKERYLSVCHLIVKNGRSVYTNWMHCLDPYNIVRMLRRLG